MSVSLPSAMASFTARALSPRWSRRGRRPARRPALSTSMRLVVALRDDALIVGEGAVDQLGGQHDARRSRRGSWRRQLRSSHLAVAVLEQPGQLDRPSCAARSRPACPRRPRAAAARPAPGDGRRWPPRAASACRPRRGVEIDAVQIIAGLFGRDGEARLVDQALQIRRRQRKLWPRSSTLIAGKSSAGSVWQLEARRGRQGWRAARLSPVAVELDVGAFGQLAHDVVEHVRRRRGGAFALGAGTAPSRRSPCRDRWRSASARSCAG